MAKESLLSSFYVKIEKVVGYVVAIYDDYFVVDLNEYGSAILERYPNAKIAVRYIADSKKSDSEVRVIKFVLTNEKENH